MVGFRKSRVWKNIYRKVKNTHWKELDRLRKTCKEKRANLIQRNQNLDYTKKDIYKLQCQCGISYIGQTGWINLVHIIRTPKGCRTGVCREVSSGRTSTAEGLHSNFFDEAKILLQNQRWNLHITRESLEIMKNSSNFNRKDGYCLSISKKIVMQDTHWKWYDTHWTRTCPPPTQQWVAIYWSTQDSNISLRINFDRKPTAWQWNVK